MQVIAFMNQKGGVGKTTTAVNLGAALAESGLRVCMIDLDPQAHLSINFGLELAQDQLNLYDVLVHEKPIVEAVHNVGPNIDLVPSSIDLAAAEIELVSVLGRELILKRRLDATPLNYDYILMDCPPSLGLLTINALAVAQQVIIPMQAHFLALQGVGKLLETVALVKQRMNPDLNVGGIVLTMFDAQTRLGSEVLSDLEQFLDAARGQGMPWSDAVVFNTRIRRNIKLAEAPSFGKSVLTYESGSHGAKDYRALADELLKLHGHARNEAEVAEVSDASDNAQVDENKEVAAPNVAVPPPLPPEAFVEPDIDTERLKAAQTPDNIELPASPEPKPQTPQTPQASNEGEAA